MKPHLGLIVGIALIAIGAAMTAGILQTAPTPDSVVVGGFTTATRVDGVFPFTQSFIAARTANLTGTSVMLRGVGLEGHRYSALLYWKVVCGTRYVNAATASIRVDGQGATDYAYVWYTLSLPGPGNQVVQGETCSVRFEVQSSDSGVSLRPARGTGASTNEYNYRVWGIPPSVPSAGEPLPGDPTEIPEGSSEVSTEVPSDVPTFSVAGILLLVLGLAIIFLWRR